MTSQLSIHQRILNHAFHKNIKQHLRTVFKIENNKKGFLSSKYKKKKKTKIENSTLTSLNCIFKYTVLKYKTPISNC